jgi:hypothetical protein
MFADSLEIMNKNYVVNGFKLIHSFHYLEITITSTSKTNSSSKLEILSVKQSKWQWISGIHCSNISITSLYKGMGKVLCTIRWYLISLIIMISYLNQGTLRIK